MRTVFNSLFFSQKNFTHTYYQNIRCQDSKQSPHILRFVSMCVLTISECEDSYIRLKLYTIIKHKNAYKRTKTKKAVFLCT